MTMQRSRSFLSLSLVVLAGCETGVAADRGGGEAEGLVRGLLGAGARGAVVGAWHVGDASTAGLMVRLHRERRRGRSADRALARAQTAMSRAGRSPFQWAGFALWSSLHA